MKGQMSVTTAMPFSLHASTAVGVAVPEPPRVEETGIESLPGDA